jgi:hypothetical protein
MIIHVRTKNIRERHAGQRHPRTGHLRTMSMIWAMHVGV